jgi:hypothetical protein
MNKNKTKPIKQVGNSILRRGGSNSRPPQADMSPVESMYFIKEPFPSIPFHSLPFPSLLLLFLEAKPNR